MTQPAKGCILDLLTAYSLSLALSLSLMPQFHTPEMKGEMKEVVYEDNANIKQADFELQLILLTFPQ